jgi:hypothetical protein
MYDSSLLKNRGKRIKKPKCTYWFKKNEKISDI